MSIIVGFVPTPAGQAALTAGIAEAKLRNEDLVIVNSARQGALVDKSVATEDVLAQAAKRAADVGVTATVIQPPYQHDLADEFLAFLDEAESGLAFAFKPPARCTRPTAPPRGHRRSCWATARARRSGGGGSTSRSTCP